MKTFRNLLLFIGAVALIVRMLARLNALERSARPAPAKPAVPVTPPVQGAGPAEPAAPVTTRAADTRLAGADVLAEARAVLDQLNAALREPAAELTPAHGDAAVATLEAPARATQASPPAPEWVVPGDAAAGAVSTVHGSFAVSGAADGARQVVIARVRFPRSLTSAPHDWCAGGDGSPAGTIVIDVDRTENCDPHAVGVVLVPGFAPTTEGFSVRIVCDAAGAYSASGCFRINDA